MNAAPGRRPRSLITLKRVAQDGTRVRASAGPGVVSAQGAAEGLPACDAPSSGVAQRRGGTGSDSMQCTAHPDAGIVFHRMMTLTTRPRALTDALRPMGS